MLRAYRVCVSLIVISCLSLESASAQVTIGPGNVAIGSNDQNPNLIAIDLVNTAILSPGTQEIVERSVPFQRLGKAEEVASLIHFLCTSGASTVPVQ